MSSKQKAILVRVDEYTIHDFCISAEEYQKLLDNQHSKTPVTVLGVGCDVGEGWESDYHDIQLADGTKLDAISGYHLKRVPDVGDTVTFTQEKGDSFRDFTGKIIGISAGWVKVKNELGEVANCRVSQIYNA